MEETNQYLIQVPLYKTEPIICIARVTKNLRTDVSSTLGKTKYYCSLKQAEKKRTLAICMLCMSSRRWPRENELKSIFGGSLHTLLCQDFSFLLNFILQHFYFIYKLPFYYFLLYMSFVCILCLPILCFYEPPKYGNELVCFFCHLWKSFISVCFI